MTSYAKFRFYESYKKCRKDTFNHELLSANVQHLTTFVFEWISFFLVLCLSLTTLTVVCTFLCCSSTNDNLMDPLIMTKN